MALATEGAGGRLIWSAASDATTSSRSIYVLTAGRFHFVRHFKNSEHKAVLAQARRGPDDDRLLGEEGRSIRLSEIIRVERTGDGPLEIKHRRRGKVQLEETSCSKAVGDEIFAALREALGDDFVYTTRSQRISKFCWSLLVGLLIALAICILLLVCANAGMGEELGHLQPNFRRRPAGGVTALLVLLVTYLGLKGSLFLTCFVSLLIATWAFLVIILPARIKVLERAD
ncbi:MAG: hypothetical protein U0793_24595 [Gemmataceae bacterium]